VSEMFKWIGLCIAIAVAPCAAFAQSVQDQIIDQLTEQGFGDFEITRTFLGRVQVFTRSDRLERGLVFNPTSGEILRDIWAPMTGNDVSPQIRLANPNNSSRSRDNTDTRRPPRRQQRD
jgi:hypothetical protein